MPNCHAPIKPYIRQFYRGNGGFFLLSVVEIFLITGCNLLISWLLQKILDLIAGEAIAFSLSQLACMALGVLGLILLASACSYFSRPRFLGKAMAQYKNYAMEQLTRKGISAFSGENTGVYLSALSSDAGVIENDYVGGLLDILQQGVLFTAAATMMLLYSPTLTLVSIGLSLLPVLVSLLTGNRMAKAEKQVSDTGVGYMSTLKDCLSGFSVIKSFRAEARMCALFAREVQRVSDAREARRKLEVLVSMYARIAGVVVQLGVFLVGACLALSGSTVTVGTVLIFVQLLNYVLNPISLIPGFLGKRKAAKALIQKLADTLEENIPEEGQGSVPALPTGITLEQVSFAYEEGRPVLQNITAHFEAGKKYAIVGTSGSGKSTLLNLLMAGSRKYSGKILYDTRELREISALYDLVSIIQQNVFLFDATIRENITLFSSFPEEQFRRAVTLSGLQPLIRERGEGFLCGENGCNLSGGEKQRIAIARSLLKQSRVLLVDEATASLDAETAHQVSGAILGLEGVTAIVVTHTLEASLLKQYDRILTLKNGTISESGSFEELMEAKGYFYSLFTLAQ